MAVQRTLGADSQRSLRIVHALQQLMQLGVAGPAFDPDRALPACGQAIFDADASADALAETQPDQAGRREDDRVVLACIKLGQTGVHIATQKLNLEVGATRQQLRLAPQAGRTYDRAGGQRIEILVVIGDERIARILPLTDAIQAEPLRKLHRHVLHGVHGDVRFVLHQGCFQFLDEEALASNFRQRSIEQLVAPTDHRHQAHRHMRMSGFQARLDVFGLPQGQGTLAGSDANFAGHEQFQTD